MPALPASRRRWRVLAPALLVVLALPAAASADPLPAAGDATVTVTEPAPTPGPAPAPTATPEPEATPTVSAPDVRPADDPSRPAVEDHVEVLAATESNVRTAATLTAPKACARTIRVGGSAIRSVAFTLDGRRLRTVKRTTARLGRLTPGAHRLVARVRFTDGTATTLTRRVSGCVAAA